MATLGNMEKWQIAPTTNGVCVDAIRRFCDLCHGRTTGFGVSIDGLPEVHDKIRRHPRAFDRAVESVNLLRAHGFPVQINTVIQRDNLGSLDAFKGLMGRLCEDVPISWTPELAAFANKQEFPFEESDLETVACRIEGQDDPALELYLSSRGRVQMKNCHAGSRTFLIAPDAKVYTCTTGFAYRDNWRDYYVGDLRSETLDEIYLKCQGADSPAKRATENCTCWNYCEVANEIQYFHVDFRKACGGIAKRPVVCRGGTRAFGKGWMDGMDLEKTERLLIDASLYENTLDTWTDDILLHGDLYADIEREADEIRRQRHGANVTWGRDSVLVDVGELLALSGDVLIRAAYQKLLGRAPDPVGMENSQNALQAGESKDRFLLHIEHSGEARKRSVFLAGLPEIAAQDLLCYDGGEFVDNLYAKLLGRVADPSGRKGYVDALRRGALTKEEIIRKICASAEGKKKGVIVRGLPEAKTKEEAPRNEMARKETPVRVTDIRDVLGLNGNAFVEGAYRALFGRAADAAGMEKWRKALTEGVDRKAILLEMESSGEARKKGIRLTGFPEVEAGELLRYDGGRFVEEIYIRLLGRVPDASGRRQYVTALRRGALTKEEVIRKICASAEGKKKGIIVRGLPEAKTKEEAPRNEAARKETPVRVTDIRDVLGLNGDAFIAGAYRALFGRAADAAGMEKWRKALTEGVDRKAILLEMESSGEARKKGIRLTGFPELEAGELLRHDDRAFVENLYVRLLGRMPDAPGLRKYLRILRSRTSTKEGIIYRILSSSEGQKRAVKLIGLPLVPTEQKGKLSVLPVVGKRLESAKNRLHRATEAIDDIVGRELLLETSLRQMRKEAEAQGEEIRSAKARMTAIASGMKPLRQGLAALSGDMEALAEESNRGLRALDEALAQEKDAARQETKKLVDDLRHLRQGLAALSKDMGALEKSLGVGFRSVDENMRASGEDLETLAGRLDAVRKESMAAIQWMADGREQLSVLEKKFHEIGENVNALNEASAARDQDAKAEREMRGGQIAALEESLRGLGENINTLNEASAGHDAAEAQIMERVGRVDAHEEQLSSLEKKFHEIGENVNALNEASANHDQIVQSQKEAIAGNLAGIESFQAQLVRLGLRMSAIEARLASGQGTSANAAVASLPSEESRPAQPVLPENVYHSIDYLDFENHFRGSRPAIKKMQEIYLPYFEGKSHVLDLGCGRGEFTELLKERGIGVTGIDLYKPYVEYMELLGLPVVRDDLLHYLGSQEKTDGIFVCQVVEHLSVEQIISLLRLAFEKLEEDCFLVIETPNPTSLGIYTSGFYIDPSHQKPVHPLTLKYFAEKAGFSEVDILFTEASRMPLSIPKLREGDADFAAFNEAMERLSNLLYGSQDYAMIARKRAAG